MAVRMVEGVRPVDLEIGGKNSLGRLSASVLRYWWVVLIVVWLALAGAAASAAAVPTTYTGRSSLIVSSNDRSPEQDAVLVQGYASYFDDASYQRQLLGQAGIHSPSTLTAEAAASSPILVVTATALDPVSAQASAVAVATAFSNDINATHARTTAAALASLQDQLDTALSRKAPQDQSVIASLQDRIRDLQADQVNVLQDLQLEGGVSSVDPPWLTNLVLGGAGGLFFGVLLALVLDALSTRVRSRYDLAHKIGLVTLADLSGDSDRRSQQVRQLANHLRPLVGGGRAVAVAHALPRGASPDVAFDLAREWAAQGFRTSLLRLGGASDELSRKRTERLAAGSLDGSRPLVLIDRGPVSGMSLVHSGPRQDGRATSFAPAAVPALLEMDELADSVVVIDAQDLVASAASQIAAASAAASLLVVDPRTSRVADTREASRVLSDAGANLLGAVLASASGVEVNDQNRIGPDKVPAVEESADAWSWGTVVLAEDPVGHVRHAHNGVSVAGSRGHLVGSSDGSGPEGR